MISVVIPTHNRADLLPRAIKSVQAQTWKDLEIVVVSDGSEDNTKEVVNELAKDDARIRFIEYFPAKGGNIARNTGIENASGEFVAFLDDDDEFMPEKLEKQMAVMESDPEIGLVYTGVRILYVNEQVTYRTNPKAQGDLSKEILLDNSVGTTSTVMARKDLLLKAGMFDINLRALQDFDLWIRVCQLCKVGLVPEEMINYYNYTGTKQVSALTDKYVEAFAYINEKYKDMLDTLTEEMRREKKYNEYMLLGNKAMRNGDGKLARKFLKAALKEQRSKKALAYYALSFTNFKTVLKLRSSL
ncbi:MAG: glycosyltransferase family 2 protein [Clostridia bacterium]|nr:glycosyltransferase family 2 protein [Clostridia bacterium]